MQSTLEAPESHSIRVRWSPREVLWALGALLVVLVIYSYPAVRTRVELGFARVPAGFAPDLTMYVALSNPPLPGGTEFLNPYYLVPVPYSGTGYLKFHLAPGLFSKLREALPGRLWLAMFLWNSLWWCALAIAAICLFARYLPGSPAVVIFGLTLLMLFNFGVFKTLLVAWTHLPSLSGFSTLGLPFMRAFVPVIPTALLIAYLVLQVEALRRPNALLMWAGMGVVQLLALAMFPYATLIMAGITMVSVVGSGMWAHGLRGWLVVLVYGLLCGVADTTFALRGSLGFYSDHSFLFHFQPELLRSLVGGNWLLLGMLTGIVLFTKGIVPEVRWCLAGLGATTWLLMLGDIVVPAKTILLSHHISHFMHTTIAILVVSLASAILVPAAPGQRLRQPLVLNWVVACATGFVIVTGVLLSIGNYRGSLSYNEEVADLAETLSSSSRPSPGSLVLARSRTVDDPCGWIFQLTGNPVLYCTAAEVMLTPKQNVDIHRFRQAVYLYLTGRDSAWLRGMLAGPKRLDVMYELGYWAESASSSMSEQQDGVRAIEHELLPMLEKVERGDPEIEKFFRQFSGVTVIDSRQAPIFSRERLASLLQMNGEKESRYFRISSYTPQVAERAKGAVSAH
jgi:hypothetical protein